MPDEAAQETLVEVSGTVTRLVPCDLHAADPPGVQLPRRNANGYHHDCSACAATPTQTEALEF